MSTAAAQKANSRLVFIWLAIMVVFIAELFAYTWCRVQSIRLGYAIAAENRRHQHPGSDTEKSAHEARCNRCHRRNEKAKTDDIDRQYLEHHFPVRRPEIRTLCRCFF